MILHTCVRWGTAALLVAATCGCVTGAKLREDASLIQKKIANARERGAYRCAPKELAKAEANLEFLDYELEQGDFVRAGRHHRAALENIDRALTVTDPNECAEKRVLISDQKPLIITKTDRDGDGIMDDVDKCPDEPEDIDGFQDEDGCPDPDNDGDGVLDKDDKCPNEPGPATNQGCPVTDRDGDGIADDVDKCPDIPEDINGFEDEDGCPEGGPNRDRDGDGIMDDVDKCPDVPEDKDSFQDEDGCPDPDNDQDGVLDVVDACPLDPGPAANNGCPARDRDGDGINDDVDQCPDIPGPAPSGCPKKVLVVKTADKIEIKQQINFATNKAKIVGQLSFDILDQVAAVMKSNPAIKIVIEGHTDSVGDAAHNLKLSDGRANAVRTELIERGVDSGRLEAIGYGESKPIASNRTAKGRAANRRSEFKIVSGGDAPPPEAPPAPTP
ncbi:MAG: OmpA family protein [Deltaproteobacteria bacterium]|nr:OmpA family protein [Deltaproteobacteria bacterium]